MMGTISFVTHEIMPLHQRKIIVRLNGIGCLAIGFWGIIATAMNWSSFPFIKISISGLAIDIAGLAYMSAGYHLLRQRGFGRVSVLILSWLNFFLWLTFGSYGIYAGTFKLALSWPINYESTHLGWFIAIAAISLFLSRALTRFLHYPETKALSQNRFQLHP